MSCPLLALALSENEVTQERRLHPSQALRRWCPRLGTFRSHGDERQGLTTVVCGVRGAQSRGAAGRRPPPASHPGGLGPGLGPQAASAQWEPRGGHSGGRGQRNEPGASPPRRKAGEGKPRGLQGHSRASPWGQLLFAAGSGLRAANAKEHLLGDRCPAGRGQERCCGRERKSSVPPGRARMPPRRPLRGALVRGELPVMGGI